MLRKRGGRNSRILVFLTAVAMLIAACQPPETVEVTREVVVTEEVTRVVTEIVTEEVEVTRIFSEQVEVTRIVEVAPEDTEPEVAPTPTRQPDLDSQCAFRSFEATDRQQGYVSGQLLVTGQPDDFDDFDRLFAGYQSLQPGEEVTLSFSGAVTRLYRLNATEELATIAEIYRQLAEVDPPLRIVVEPNYLTGAPWEIGGAPWEIGGAPWEIGGAPWEIGGAPWLVNGFLVSDRGLGHYYGQNAITDITLPMSTPDSSEILVYVLDSSPFIHTVSEVPPVHIAGTLGHLPELGELLHVFNPPTAVDFITNPSCSLREHGLFVAGLAHRVAPTSPVHLYRVLDDNGRGDMFTFLSALDLVTAEANLSNRVVNLSLRILSDPTQIMEFSSDVEESIARQFDAVGAEFQILLDPDDPVPSLLERIAGATDRGAIFIAASGNDQLPEPKIPAVWPETVAVAGSNTDGNQACFSNAAEAGSQLFAASGDGCRPGSSCVDYVAGDPGTGQCYSPAIACEDAACMREHGLASVISGTPGFAYWAGTSFATPLVSGTTALLRASCPSATPSELKSHLTEITMLTEDVTGIPQLNVTALLDAWMATCP